MPTNAPLIREPISVLETRKIGVLLLQLTQEKTKMAILLDEYGGTSGIVTTEDIIEQVVGDIVDEYDRLKQLPDFVKHSENPLVLETSGRMSIRELNQQFDLKLSEEGTDTVGGYVLRLLGQIPSVGESAVDENGIEFKITATEGNLITRLLLRGPIIPERETEI